MTRPGVTHDADTECHRCGGPAPDVHSGAYTREHGRICDNCWDEVRDNG